MSTISFVWEPDPAVYARSLRAVELALKDKTAPLVAAGESVRMDIRERFMTETDPSGNRWQDWAESYQDYATLHNQGILVQTTELMEAATSTEVIMIRGDTVFYDTQALPHYGLAHDAGLPDRDHPLPQREFLGMSESAKATVFATFSEWFDRSIDLFVTASGKIGKRHMLRGPDNLFVTRRSMGKGPL